MSLTPDFTIKRNDVGKILAGVLKDANENAVNCTGFTSARIIWKNLFTDAVKINGATFNIPTPSTGAWNYACVSGDVDSTAWYKMELEVSFGPTAKMTFPTDPDSPFLIVRVQDDLG